MECAPEDRTARGYCDPDDHQDEVDFFEEITLEEVVTVPEPVTELPYTGVDPILGLVGTLSLVVGVLLVRYAKHAEA